MSRSIILDNDGKAVYNAGFDMDELIDQLPAGLERAILDVLKFHVGHELKISGDHLLRDLKMMGFPLKDDRPARLVINQLRKQGIEICSTGGNNSGYWLAKDHEELEEYLVNEPLSRMKDLGEQIQAMRSAANKKWGKFIPKEQIPMF